MLKLEQWCPEKPTLIRIIAHDIILSSNSYYESLLIARNSTIPEHFPKPKIHDWFKFYEQKEIGETLENLFGDINAGDNIGMHICLKCLNPNYTYPEELNRLTEEQIYSIHIDSIADSFKEREATKTEIQFVKEKVLTSEFLFLWKVINPCQILFDAHPNELFSKAIKGDVKSLCNLLRLDKLLIQHPKISKCMSEFAMQENKLNFDKISKAYQKPISMRHTIGTVKAYFGGYLLFMVKLIKQVNPEKNKLCSITISELRQLFDAIAYDFHGELIDQDLPESEEAFAKAIYRHEKRFNKRFLTSQNTVSYHSR